LFHSQEGISKRGKNMLKENCVVEGNKLYYWNDELGVFDIYTLNSIMPLNECPPAILVKFLNLINKNSED